MEIILQENYLIHSDIYIYLFFLISLLASFSYQG